MSSGHRWHSIGDEMLRFLVAAYQVDGKVHWPTLVSSCAALAGEEALFGCAPDMPAEGYFHSAKVAELVYSETSAQRSLWGYAALIADQAFGIQTDDLPSHDIIVAQIGTNLLPGGFPALQIPAHIMPHESPLHAGPRHRKSIGAIAAHHKIDFRDCAFCLITAAMKSVGFTQNLGLADMTSLVLQSTVAASRFAPMLNVPELPAYGQITDVIPRSRETNIAPPVLDESKPDIWGAKRATEAVTPAPRPAPVEHHAEPEPQRVAFGRRR